MTAKEKLFCELYVKSFNATQAAKKAGYSVRRASEIGYQLLQKTTVKEEIDRLKELKRQFLLVGEEDIVERYIRIAFSDMTDYISFGREEVPVMTMLGPALDDEGNALTKEVNVVKLLSSGDVDGSIISQIKQSKDGVSVKLHDQMKALDWLSNYFGISGGGGESGEDSKGNIARLIATLTAARGAPHD